MRVAGLNDTVPAIISPPPPPPLALLGPRLRLAPRLLLGPRALDAPLALDAPRRKEEEPSEWPPIGGEE